MQTLGAALGLLTLTAPYAPAQAAEARRKGGGDQAQDGDEAAAAHGG